MRFLVSRPRATIRAGALSQLTRVRRSSKLTPSAETAWLQAKPNFRHPQARQAGHSPTMALATYGHVVEELEDAERQPAEDVIRHARPGTPEKLSATPSGQP